MIEDPRDELWNAAFRAYYDSYYEELVAAAMISRWEPLDDLTKVLVALTASGSAVTGWVLWQHPGFRTAWAVLAGCAAVLSILSGALRVSSRVKDWGDVWRKLAPVRVDFEALRDRMRVNSNFNSRDSLLISALN